METKVCSKCKEEKSSESFYKDKNTKDGFWYHCKDCEKIISKTRKENYKENRKLIIKKVCSKCKEEKNIENFSKDERSKSGFQSICKDCFNKYCKQNSEIIKENNNKWRKSNKKCKNEHSKKWRKDNQSYQKEYHKKRRANEPLYKFISNIRCLINQSIKKYGYVKTSHSYEILGISYEELMKSLFEAAKMKYFHFQEKDFLESNKYHIDHIIPLATAKTEEDIIRLCHYTNLQLLTKEDNLSKSNKIE